MLTALEPRNYRDAAKRRVKLEHVGKDPDWVLKTKGAMKVKYVYHAEIEAQNKTGLWKGEMDIVTGIVCGQKG